MAIPFQLEFSLKRLNSLLTANLRLGFFAFLNAGIENPRICLENEAGLKGDAPMALCRRARIVSNHRLTSKQSA